MANGHLMLLPSSMLDAEDSARFIVAQQKGVHVYKGADEPRGRQTCRNW